MIPRLLRRIWELKKIMLQIENVSFSYGPILALQNISFEVGEGQCVALIGSNGSGKSTLMKNIFGA